MPEDLELDQDEPEATKLFGGAVTVGRALRAAFPSFRRPGIDWKYYGHQGFPWCPHCGAIVAGLGGVVRGSAKRGRSKGQRTHEQYHEWLDGQADLLAQLADLMGIDAERDGHGTEYGGTAGSDSDGGGPDRGEN
jgi:hypothetical protein